jgi:ribosomal-protein-alanine N-acetyltransferase
MVVSYHIQRANTNEVSAHLKRCDNNFVPKLSSRVSIDNYAKKIVKKAKTFEAWANGELIGLVAAYCNSPDQLILFITNVSVLPDWAGKGIATQLLTNCISSVRKLGFEKIELEVGILNGAAIALYTKNGFTTTAYNAEVQNMTAFLKDFLNGTKTRLQR